MKSKKLKMGEKNLSRNIKRILDENLCIDFVLYEKYNMSGDERIIVVKDKCVKQIIELFNRNLEG